MGGFTINSTAPLELLPHYGDGNIICTILKAARLTLEQSPHFGGGNLLTTFISYSPFSLELSPHCGDGNAP